MDCQIQLRFEIRLIEARENGMPVIWLTRRVEILVTVRFVREGAQPFASCRVVSFKFDSYEISDIGIVFIDLKQALFDQIKWP